MKLALVKPIDDTPAAGASQEDFESNALLAQMPGPAQLDVRPFCDRIALVPGERLFRVEDSPRYLYFPLSGAIDLVGTLPSGQALAMALVDPHGVAGLPPLGNAPPLPLEAIVQLPGSAMRMRLDVFTRLRHDLTVANIFYSYLYTLTNEMIQGTLCNTFHAVEQRCARWLLALCDIAGPAFFITHEQLSTMLGVRRPSVTVEAVALKQRGAIAYQRGRMTIQNRAALEASACSCYQTLRDYQSRPPVGDVYARSRSHVVTR
jgi:CRP-like cAMP-binding protein